jgi:hypothetical protein
MPSTIGSRRHWLLVVLVAALIILLAAAGAQARPCNNCQHDEHAGGTATPAPITVTGTFRYADTAGLRPIAFANVEVWSFAPHGIFNVWSWSHERTVTTDGAGRISATFPFDVSGVIYGLRVYATNYAAVVWPNDAAHTLPFHVNPGEPSGTKIERAATAAGQSLDFSWDFTDGWTPQHFNLAESVRRGFDFASARRDPRESDPIPPAGVQPTSVTGSWYNPTADTVVITSGAVLADLLILHEYAHYLEDQIGSFPWIASTHDGCVARDLLGADISSPEHAWMEGFANWFAQAVARNDPGAGLTGLSGAGGGTSSVGVLETPASATCTVPAGMTGDKVENRVAGVLWDLTDDVFDVGSAAEVADSQANNETTIFQIMDRELDVPPHGGPWPSINTFSTAWTGRGLDANSLGQIKALNGIFPVLLPPSDPPAEPSENVCAKKPWTPGC